MRWASGQALARRRAGDGGWRDVELDVANLRAFQPGGVALDLSSIAKGYAVDLCAERLRELGVPSFLMEIGGEFVGQGVKPDAQPWWVELELSDLAPAPGEPGSTDVALVNLAVATSGDFVRRRDGVSHLSMGARARRWMASCPAWRCCMRARWRPMAGRRRCSRWGSSMGWRWPKRKGLPWCLRCARAMARARISVPARRR